MPIPLLNTKLYISPPRAEIVSRPALVERLEKGLQGKLTLVSAPAGFGKTTLLKEWIAAHPDSVSWVSLDSGDNDPIRFWAYVVAAIQRVRPGCGESIAASLQTPQPPPLQYLITDLINEIGLKTDKSPCRGDLQGKHILVLDDYHLITDRQVQDTLNFFLEHLPPSVHLVIAGRADPPWPLARLRARLRMAELRAEDLRFSLQEASHFLNLTMGLDLSPANITALEERTEGWIVGLQMAALSMRTRSDKNTFIRAFTGTHRYILDYLLEEVLDQQPQEIRAFLLKTSILERMTADLCNVLLEINQSQKILSHLEAANLFVISLDDDRSWYRYHHLFSELLKSQLKLIHPDQVPRLHQRASQWFEDHHFIEETIHHAFAAEDEARLARLIEKYALGMLQDSRYTQVSAWIEALPQELVLSRPWLCVFQSWTRHWAGQRQGGEACLQNAEDILDKTPSLYEKEAALIQGYIATVRAHYALINEALPETIAQAQKALHFLPEDDYFTRGTARIALGGAYWGEGKVWQAEAAFRECASDALRGGYSYRASSALTYAGMQQVKQARLYQAEETFQKSLALSTDSEGRTYPNAGYPLAKLGELACEWNQLQEANERVTRGVELCRQLGHVDLIAEANAALARVQLARRDYEGAEATLDQTDQLAMEVKLDPWAITWLQDCRLRLWISKDRLDQVQRWVSTTDLTIDGPFNYQHDLAHINLARALMTLGMTKAGNRDFEQELDLLHRLSRAAEQAGWLHQKIEILILMAIVHQVMGETDSASNVILRALTLSEPSNYIRTFIAEGAAIGALLKDTLELHKNQSSIFANTLKDYIGRLISALEEEREDPQQQPTAALIEPLTDRELDVLRLLVTNQTVPEIAEVLVISPNTVRSHVKHIYDKLDVHRRLSAVQKAKALKLV